MTDLTFTDKILERTGGKPYHLTKPGAHYPVEVWTNGNIIIHHPCPVCDMESGLNEDANDWHDNVCSGRFLTEYEAV